MRLRLSFFVAIFLGIAIALPTRGDFVRTSRASTVKDQPTGDATVLLHPDIGADFVLDSPDQTNGYYKIRLPSGGLGWIYRTLVRRFAGTPDSQPSAGGGGGTNTIATGDFTASADSMVAHFINVGQGASTLLEFSCGAILIDTGGEQSDAVNSTTNLRNYLDAFFQRRQDLHNTIDLLVLSHAHIDHTRGVPEVLMRYRIRSAIDNALESGSGGDQQRGLHNFARNSHAPTLTTYQGINETDIASTDGLTNATIDPVACTGTDPRVRVLWGSVTRDLGWTAGDMDNGNNHSVVVRLDFGQSSFLFTGDLQEAGIQSLLDFYQGTSTLNVDVWEVGHHGSLNATTRELLQAMTPKIAAIEMGNSNLSHGPNTAFTYAHPRDVTVDLLTDPAFGVSGRRPQSVTEPVGVKGACMTSRCNPQHPSVFSQRTTDRAIYGTGWDGTIRISARANGEIRVATGQ